MKILKNISLFFVALVSILSGCSSDPPSIGPYIASENATYSVGDTTYLEINPPFQSGFSGPTALLFGKDQLLYVADFKNNRVVMMDIAGGYLGECSINQPTALAQDYKLDLLVGGVDSATGAGAIYRIKLFAANHQIDSAKIILVRKESSHPQRRFVGIGVMPGSQYLAARTGTDNTSSIDPDTRIMWFDTSDTYLTPVTDLTTGSGSGINYINYLSGFTTYPNSRDFIVLQRNLNSSAVDYGAIYMKYSSSSDFQGWTVPSTFDPALSNVDFIHLKQYVFPFGVTIDSKRLDVFITDVAQDSVFKFNSKGTHKKESFGRYATNNRMVSPVGVAFDNNKTLYVADSTKNCIFRFKLSTDF
jgi:hypothetical protein